ncbi:MAG: xylulokinase [Chloroflexota bacterium]
MDSLYLGIDVGSGSVKVMLVDARGKPSGSASAPYSTKYPHPGHVEQNPDDWYVATCRALRALIGEAGIDAGRIRGIGLSGTSHVASMLDQKSNAVRPAILFNDVRSEAQVRRLEFEAGDLIAEKTGNAVNCTWSLPQILWVREHEPEVFSHVRYVLFSKDYLTYRLTGQSVGDHSSAVSSLMVDAATLEWDRELLKLAGLTPDMVPDIQSSLSVVGELTREAASDTGLQQGVPVVAGMLDSAAELVGAGATSPSIAVIRLGTAGGVMTIVPRPRWRKGCMLYPHPVRPQWYYQAGTNAATASFQWALRLFGMGGEDVDYQGLDDLVAQVPAGTDGLLFHPYLLGERAPYWSSRIRGGFSGVTMDHDRAAFLRAVQEGVAYSLRDCTSLLDWTRVSDIRVCGGGAKSRTWCRIIADVLGLPVYQMQILDASAFGAALAAVAGCTQKDLGQFAFSAAKEAARIEPEAKTRDVYESGYYKYQEIAAQYLETFGNA